MVRDAPPRIDSDQRMAPRFFFSHSLRDIRLGLLLHMKLQRTLYTKTIRLSHFSITGRSSPGMSC